MITYNFHYLVAQVSPRERQTVIDGFFSPISAKNGMQLQHINESKKSHYFCGVNGNDAVLVDNTGHETTDLMQIDELIQAVPTHPISTTNICFGEQGLPNLRVVPDTRSTRNTTIQAKNSKKANKVLYAKDPSTVYAGGVRLQSIKLARSIHDVLGDLNNSPDSVYRQEGATVALVELIGTLCSPMIYRSYCWEFTVRDPTTVDFARRYSVAKSSSLDDSNKYLAGASTLLCCMYDIDGSVDQDSLERDEIVRIMGIIKYEPISQMQCVAIRSASVDEIRMTIQGIYRGYNGSPVMRHQ
ncbi:hypothetical protein BX616_003781 [Lobosporangium transversale]|uniref:Uncharacterized protein n=1 Tax=Lobosporangium transversale TaxID=64571 RepID=A0A1Y2GV99_9FUNG|nr:hypothetical protein BCR41DRAFT_416284 [Lobosporangium transversale]KAF9916430.1 hypothetical protein BX616_003781 [Lobosporangium transversale]ORZ25012.1 hypothetical protein BCR41DRAFT_416284 [Lobosporangium transversale]|eukprot:XP_021883993.1 hypothetical protein BCR41DRAFT_416284 [Lobosporangium transversale]